MSEVVHEAVLEAYANHMTGDMQRMARELLERRRAPAAPATPARDDLIPALAALRDVLAERTRQVADEGWTHERDDQYDRDELSAAAACYAHFGWVKPCTGEAPTEWPWAAAWWKPTDRRRNLVKAGALILAEIERLDRAAVKRAGPAG